MEEMNVSGKTLEEAIQNALRELGVKPEEMSYQVVEEGSKGILGFGAKPFVIKAHKIAKSSTQQAHDFLRDLLSKMNILAEIRVRQEGENIQVNLAGPKMGLIIGHRGETLDAIQYLTNLAVNKHHSRDEYQRVVIDTEGYREKREETLKYLAEKTASKVKKYGHAIKLDPMNPYERRIIHSKLQEIDGVTTHSEGQDPYRKVVVSLEGEN